MYKFPVVEKSLNSICNIEHIHPRKQRLVREVLKIVPVVSIFGSATRWDCNEKSDIDILVDKNDVKIPKEELFNKLVHIENINFDLLWKDEIELKLNKFQKKNIIDESVKVYER